MRSAPSIGFEYRPSRWPRLLLLALGALAVLAIFLSGIATVLAWLLAGLVAAHVAWSCRRAMEHAIAVVTWRADGGWSLRLDHDEDVEARLLGARMMAGAIILRLAWPPRRREALILLPDNLDADTRRRLRMRLSASPDSD